MTQNITARQAYEWLKNGEAILIDVREPEEFKTRHIAYAQSLPLSCFSYSISDLNFPSDRKIIMQCLKGKRGETACGMISDPRISANIFNIEGGISAWEMAGLPIVGQAEPKLSIFRQVQIIVGGLIAMFIALGFLGLGVAFFIAGVFATALFIAGLTGWCGLALILQKMPWNNPPKPHP